MNDATLVYQRDLLTIAIERYKRSNDELSIENYYRAKTERDKIHVEIARRYLEKRRDMNRCKRHRWGAASGFMNTINGHGKSGMATSRTCEVCGIQGWFRLIRSGVIGGRIS